MVREQLEEVLKARKEDKARCERDMGATPVAEQLLNIACCYAHLSCCQ